MLAKAQPAAVRRTKAGEAERTRALALLRGALLDLLATGDEARVTRALVASCSPATQVAATSAGVASAKALASASSCESACRRATSSVDDAAGRSHSASNSLPTEKSPMTVRQPEHVGAGGGGQVQQVPRGEPVALAAEQLLGEVGLQPLLEQREAGPGADVGAERDPDAEGQVRASGNRPLPRAAFEVGQCATRRRRAGRATSARAASGARCGRARCAVRAARSARTTSCSRSRTAAARPRSPRRSR